MDILYQDNSILVCIKPAGVLSTDEPGGMPELVRQALGDPKACVRTVHRLDRVVSGLMVLARTPGGRVEALGADPRARLRQDVSGRRARSSFAAAGHLP